MEKEETTPAWVTVGVHSFAKADEEMATDGLLLVLLAGGMGAHKRISSHTTQGCIHLLTGLRKLWMKIEVQKDHNY